MKELLASIFQYGPRYLDDLLSLITRPKQSLLSLLSPDDAVIRSLIFFLASLGLSLVFELALVPKDVSTQVWIAKHLTFHLMAAIGLALMILISFAIVRGRASPASFLVVILYISGVWFLLWGLLATSAKGVVLSTVPESYSSFVDLANDMFMPISKHDYSDPASFAFLFETRSAAPLFALLLLFTIYLAGGIWFFICWGAFRQVTGVSRARSFVAFLLAQVFCTILWYVLAPVMVGLRIMPF